MTMTMTMKGWTTMLALLALAAAPAAGQQMPMAGHGQPGAFMAPDMMQMCHSMMGGGGMMSGQGAMGHSSMMGGGGMMEGMAPSPAALLGASEQLSLTADQKAKIEVLAKSANESHKTHMEGAASAGQKATAALQGDAPDLKAYEADLQEAAQHMVQAHVAMTRASLDARVVLTPEQRKKLQEGTALMGSMMCGMMGQGRMMSGGHGAGAQFPHGL